MPLWTWTTEYPTYTIEVSYPARNRREAEAIARAVAAMPPRRVRSQAKVVFTRYGAYVDVPVTIPEYVIVG